MKEDSQSNDSEDDVPQLSGSTQAILELFYKEREDYEQSFKAAVGNFDDINFEENWVGIFNRIWFFDFFFVILQTLIDYFFKILAT